MFVRAPQDIFAFTSSQLDYLVLFSERCLGKCRVRVDMVGGTVPHPSQHGRVCGAAAAAAAAPSLKCNWRLLHGSMALPFV